MNEILDEIETKNKKKEENKNLLIFFLITFIISWSIWLIPVLLNFSAGLRFIFFAMGVIGPFFGACITSFFTEKWSGVNQLWKRVWSLKFEKKWLIPTIFGIPIIFFTLDFIMGVSIRDYFYQLFVLNLISIIIWFILFFFAAIFEEIGWRGYALDKFQSKANALITSIVLGLIWGLWHLPLLIYYWYYPISFIIIYLIFVILLSIMFTFLYNNTESNIFIVILFHTIINIWLQYFFPIFAISRSIGYFYLNWVLFIIDLIIVVIYKPKYLSYRKNY